MTLRRSLLSYIAILVAVPALAQNAPLVAPASAPVPASIPVAATTTVSPVPPADLKAALDAEASQKKTVDEAQAALLALQKPSTQATLPVSPKTESTKIGVSQEEPPATMNPPNAQAATDALARALADQAERAAQTAALADAQRAADETKAKDLAFKNAIDGTFPMSPDQIKEVMRKFEETQYAVVPPSYGQPKGETAVTTVSLDPGAEPPEIKVAVGYVTTLTILDASGQPWAIQDIGVGGNFDVPQPEAGSHIIRISPMTRFGYGNLSVRLKDLPTPVTFRISAGNDIVHYRYDARIPRMGPNAKMSLIQKQKIVAGDDLIMAVLDNAIPTGSQKLKVTGTDKRTTAYAINDRVFVRTPLTLLSPSWDASVSSADGTTVYEVGQTPVLLLSDQGQMVRAKISDDGA